jgi:mannose/cellobiose epimerase-like protein (N-acyl-D-glucosamine 2-epimerase family)
MNLGGRRKIKTIDMHTNVLEGMMYLCKVSKDPQVGEALEDLLDLICRRGIFRDYGCTVTAFDYDWNPIADGNGKLTTCYGLNVELAWLILEAVDALGLARDKYRGPILGLIDHALDFGFDHERGGLAAYGPPTGHVLHATDLPDNRLVKTWWAQAEMLNALIAAWEWTEDDKYLRAFVKLFDWVQARQIDHECGDWYQEVEWATGRPLILDKGREFKTAFHAGRALIRVIDGLTRILGSPASP